MDNDSFAYSERPNKNILEHVRHQKLENDSVEVALEQGHLQFEWKGGDNNCLMIINAPRTKAFIAREMRVFTQQLHQHA